MIIARQSTARTVTVGPVLDADGVAVTDAAVGDLKIAKNGGAPAALNGSATLTHRNTGHYSLALTTSDLDTVGQAEIVIDKTTDAMPPKEITVLEEAVYDALFAASAAGYGTAQTGDSFARLGAPAGASVSADIAAVKTDTAAILVDTGTTLDGKLDTIDQNVDAILDDTGTSGVVVASIANNAITAAAIANGAIDAATFAADVDAEILSYIVDDATRIDASALNTHSAITAAGIADAVWEEALADHEGTSGSTAEALADAGGSGASAADIADAVLDEALSGHTTAGTLGKAVADILTDTAEIGAAGAGLTSVPWNASWDAEVQSEVADALTAYDPPTNAEMEARTLAAASYATAASQATITTHLTDIKGATWASTDSLEAIRDRGDSAWITATSVTVSDKTGFKLASDGLDSVLVESGISAGASLTNDAGTQLTSINARQALSITISSLGGVLAGAETTNVTIKPAGLPAGNTRVNATVTADGNRTALTIKVPT